MEIYCVGKIDIKDYFDNIDHEILLNSLEKYNVDKPTRGLIEKLLKPKIEYEGVIIEKNKGIIQGSPLSPILANIYLNEFDKTLEIKNVNFARFSDDIFIFEKKKDDVYNLINKIENILKDDFKLNIKNEKVLVGKVEEMEYLGYKIIKSNEQIEFVKKNKEKNKVNYFWRSSTLKYENNEFHIINEGILTKKDFSLLFENKDKKRYLPVEATNTINIYSNIILSSGFFDYINNKNIITNFFNKNGIYIGKFLPSKSRKSALTVLNQVKMYNDNYKRLSIAKNILKAAIHNMLSNLKYYQRRYEVGLNEKIDKINNIAETIEHINEYNKLLLTEARIREIYYSCFNMILKQVDFYFYKRTKRPPKDNINSLISFGNTILYNIIAKEIYKTTLDIRIGYLHSSNNRYETLNLDIAEIFKPIIVDRLIFKLINKKILNTSLHFENKNDGVFLNDEGKKVFIKNFYEKIRENIKCRNGMITYETIMRKEIYKFINFVNNNERYKPYIYY